MNLDKDISQRIEVMRFPLIAGVVFIHAFPIMVNVGAKLGLAEPSRANVLIRTFFSEVLARISVPMLFVVSAFLFFQGLKLGAKEPISASYFIKKWKGRLRTLLFPFLFWNVFSLLVILAIQHSPFSYFYGNTAQISNFGVYDTFNALFGITHAPIAYPFWFIRNLMLYVLFSPLIYFLIRYLPIPWLVLTGGIWLLQLWKFRLPDAPGLFFFSLGSYLALWPINWKALDRRIWFVGISYVLLAYADLVNKSEWYSGRLHNLTCFVGVLFVFSLAGKLERLPKLRELLLILGPASFFVFAMHEPFLTILRKSTYLWLRPNVDWLIVLLYFVNPVAIILLSVFLYRILVRYFPRVTSAITGGR